MSDRYTEPTYAPGTPHRSPGIFGQGLVGTVVLLLGVIVGIFTITFAGYVAGLVAFALVALVLAPLTIRVGHRSGGQWLLARLAWAWHRRHRRHLYRSGVLSLVPGGSYRLPGVLASIEAYEFTTGLGQKFAVLHMPAVGMWTAFVSCQPEGSELVDAEEQDRRVAGWAGFLGNLSRLPDLVAAAQTVEAVPDQGSRLAAEVDRIRDPDAPEMGQRALLEAVESMPRGQARLTSRLALTWRTTLSAGRRSKEDRPEAMASHIAAYLPGICQVLLQAGAGYCVPMSLGDIAADVRSAFSLEAAARIEAKTVAGGEAGIGWADCGPTGAQEAWAEYRHDDAKSVTWAMAAGPQGAVFRTALRALLTPDSEVPRKRLTMLYRPYQQGQARREADRAKKTARFHASKNPHGNAFESVAMRAAERTEQELAHGASMLSWTMFVTATVAADADLDQAVVNVQDAAIGADIELRRCYGHQAAGFAAGLGVGVVPSMLVQVPPMLRDNL
ncbi:MAG: hypothetical protein J2P19_01070 [Pseudonocardia sp.]|nr:hypothetical protein [Pseudonocardia sp.]